VKPKVTFPDPENLIIDYLKAAYLARIETYKPTVFNPDFPSDPLSGNPTRLQVELEVGNADAYPISERAQVRVTCHAAPGKRDNVKAVASLTQTLLYSHPGTASIAGVFIQTGRSDVITDPATKNLMVWLLVRVVLKATPLAS
jgi:hypothetical protein